MKLSDKKIYLASFFVIFFSFLLIVNLSSAAILKTETQTDIEKYGKKAAEKSYDTGTTNNVYSIVQVVINAFLSIIGVLLLVYLLYAGFTWMTAQGDEEKVTKAKETIQRALIGLVIIVSAYAISIFVMAKLEAGTLKGAKANPINVWRQNV